MTHPAETRRARDDGAEGLLGEVLRILEPGAAAREIGPDETGIAEGEGRAVGAGFRVHGS